MNRLDEAKRAQIVRCLVEGNSIRATVRMTGAAKNTIVKLLCDLGPACLAFTDQALRDLNCKNVQVDEIWSFVYAKDKNVPKEHDREFGYGNVWTWTALDADTKLIVSWFVGSRDTESGTAFLADLKSRIKNRIQLTSDGHRIYLKAVADVFGEDVDYAMLVKIYGNDYEGERRYSPAVCLGAEKSPVNGNPVDHKISTSYVERQNLTMRMSMRRFTRLTNAFSKKLDNHVHALSLYFLHYNFCRVHQTLKKTPAMAAGIAVRPWTVEDIVRLLDKE